MQILPATSADIPELCQLLACLFAQEAEFSPNPEAQARGLAAIIGDPKVGEVLIARQAGTAVGMVNLLYTVSTALGAPVALLEDMVVAPDMRGLGLGSALIEAAIARAREAGCRRITLLTDADNQSAQRFYARHGFSVSPMIALRRPLD